MSPSSSHRNQQDPVHIQLRPQKTNYSSHYVGVILHTRAVRAEKEQAGKNYFPIRNVPRQKASRHSLCLHRHSVAALYFPKVWCRCVCCMLTVFTPIHKKCIFPPSLKIRKVKKERQKNITLTFKKKKKISRNSKPFQISRIRTRHKVWDRESDAQPFSLAFCPLV